MPIRQPLLWDFTLQLWPDSGNKSWKFKPQIKSVGKIYIIFVEVICCVVALKHFENLKSSFKKWKSHSKLWVQFETGSLNNNWSLIISWNCIQISRGKYFFSKGETIPWQISKFGNFSLIIYIKLDILPKLFPVPWPYWNYYLTKVSA